MAPPLLALLALAPCVVAHARDADHADAALTNDTIAALVIFTALVAVSILFEKLHELLRDKIDDLNMPFVHSVFRELATLGFIGLVLFVVSQLDVLPRLSQTYLGEASELQEMIEELHMGLFFFLIMFLVLCCALLHLGRRAQREWRAFECRADDLPSVVGDYIVATEPPSSWRERLSLSRWRRARRAERELVYTSLRQRFLDFRSNHPDPERAKRLAKDFQLDPDVSFPFDEYLSILSGEIMVRLLEIDGLTWIVVELCVVVVVVVRSWVSELATLVVAGGLLVALNDVVHRRVMCMRELLTPTRLADDAEKLRRSNASRAQHNLPLRPVDETNALLEACGSAEDDEDPFAPPYATLAKQCTQVSEVALARHQRQLLGGGQGNGVRLAIFSTRLVFLLTAMHLATFLMRTRHALVAMDLSLVVTVGLVVLLVAPSVLVTFLSVRIARDGVYAFSVEHLKVHRVIARVMRTQRARRTLRTLRFVAEMKIYLRETVHRQPTPRRPPSTKSTASIAMARTTSGAFRLVRIPSSDSTRRLQPLSLTAYMTPVPPSDDWDRREIYEIFCLFDVDGSGCVSRDEMANLLLALTHDLDDAELGRLMDDLVGNDDACEEITFDDFLAWCRANMQQCALLHEDLVSEIFHMIDVDKSGAITVDEFIVVFERLGHSLDHDDVRELVCQMDRNADGKIDLEEFTRMLHKHEV